MNDDAHRSVDRQRDALDQRMRDRNEFDFERPEREFLSLFDSPQLDLVDQAELLQLALDQRESELSGVYRDVHRLQHERQRADVVFVRMSQDYADQFFAMVLDIGEVGNRDIGAE